MARAGWRWGPAVLAALGAGGAARPAAQDGLSVWTRLEGVVGGAARAAAGGWPVEPAEARARLVQLLGAGCRAAPAAGRLRLARAAAFAPRERGGVPRLVLAEAGTGVGKTLGYIAPASLWAEKNRGAVWISTFTRNLQRQIDRELDRLYPDPAAEAPQGGGAQGPREFPLPAELRGGAGASCRRGARARSALGLMARWAVATRDGDMVGGDFPGWLADLLGRGRTVALADRRGECIYSACPHYRRCFIEHDPPGAPGRDRRSPTTRW